MQRGTVLASLLSLASGLALASCGGDAEAADGRKRIAVIPKGTTHEFWKSIHAGAESAAEELDVQVIWKGPLREDDRDGQIKVVEDFISRGVDGIVLAPLDSKALITPVRDAMGEGIPVVIVDSDLDWDGRVSYVATDNYLGGVKAAQELGRRLDGQGKAIMMRYMEGSASTSRREAGFLDTMEKEFPGVEMVSSNQYCGASNEGAYQTSENLLISFPEVDGIFCPNESAAFGMLRALQDADRAGSVRFVGFDASEKLVEGLRAGEIDALVIQDPFKMGDVGVRTMLAHLNGESVDERIDTGVAVATRENMGEPRIHGLLVPDLSILDG